MQTQKKKEQRKNVPSLEVITNHKLNLSIKQTKKKNFKCSNVDTFGMALIKTCSSDGLRWTNMILREAQPHNLIPEIQLGWKENLS